MHFVEPVVSEYLPFSQSVHSIAFAKESFPAGHNLQEEKPALPSTLVNRPGGQGSQPTFSVKEPFPVPNFPAVQFLHTYSGLLRFRGGSDRLLQRPTGHSLHGATFNAVVTGRTEGVS